MSSPKEPRWKTVDLSGYKYPRTEDNVTFIDEEAERTYMRIWEEGTDYAARAFDYAIIHGHEMPKEEK